MARARVGARGGKQAASKPPTRRAAAPLTLFGCQTADHGEDWFVVARSASAARRIHEDEEGYERGDAEAEAICALPAFLQGTTEAGWPSRAVLEACGGEIVKGDGADGAPRVVRINGRLFGEGDVTELAKALAGRSPKH